MIQEQEDMKRQTRPFSVEVKHRRGPTKKQSIWGNLNIAAVAEETMRDLERDEPTSVPLVDSGAVDGASDDHPPVEHTMPDPQEVDTAGADGEVPAAVEAPEPKKRAPRPKGRRRQLLNRCVTVLQQRQDNSQVVERPVLALR
jgi:hypothetical protein